MLSEQERLEHQYKAQLAARRGKLTLADISEVMNEAEGGRGASFIDVGSGMSFPFFAAGKMTPSQDRATGRLPTVVHKSLQRGVDARRARAMAQKYPQATGTAMDLAEYEPLSDVPDNLTFRSGPTCSRVVYRLSMMAA